MLLVNAIPGFEFPRKNLFDYTIEVQEIPKETVTDDDFVISPVYEGEEQTSLLIVDNSRFNVELSTEEIYILALLMKQGWVQRQVTSIENVRMKYSGTDFKMTSQANHLSKLLSLLEESRRDSFHMQRLYKRRTLSKDGTYKSNWSELVGSSALE